MRTTAPARAIRPATPQDWPAIEQLLTARELPTAGARDHLDGFLLCEEGTSLVGCAAMERYGDLGLLRSVAVTEAVAGAGVGGDLVRAALGRARSQGIRKVSLLTTTAADYFPRFGFRAISRDALPSALAGSEELRGACPASAVAMQLDL
jgi:amino-acid N-acetyltransferase